MTNISHEQARADVLRGRDDLKATERTALDEHLRACADCRAYADEIVVMHVTVRGTLQRRWDAARPAADVAPTIAARLSGRKFPQQAFSFVAGLAALVALVLLLQAFFTQQTQVKTAQSPLATASGIARELNASLSPLPTPTPIQIALLEPTMITVSRVLFWPDQTVLFDRNVASDLSVELQAASSISATVLATVYGLRADERLPDCLARNVPVDGAYRSIQIDYAAGPLAFTQRFMFMYVDEGMAVVNRLVMRLSVIDRTESDRLLYCAQQVYAVSINVTPAPPTPAPTATPGPALPATPYEPPIVTPTPLTPTPEPSATPLFPETPTPYVTPRYETPTPQLMLTPATPTPTSSLPTSTPTPLVPVTPQAGLVIRGLVQQSDGTRLGNVKIYRAFASYPGEVVATTDPAGYYQSQFQPIPGDEMVRVWAELPGYTFEPVNTTIPWAAGAYTWRHYHGYWETTLNFTAQAAP